MALKSESQNQNLKQHSNPENEAACLYRLHGSSFVEVQKRIEQQFNTLHLRAQSLIGMATTVVTVTGFSGRIIAGTSILAKGLIVAGLLFVIVGAIWVFYKVLPLQWVTSSCLEAEVPEVGKTDRPACSDPNRCKCCDPAAEQSILTELIDRRNHRTRAYRIGGWILCIGLFIYGCAISMMLIAG